MARRGGVVVVTYIELPADGVFQFVGKGLVENTHNYETPITIDVDAGRGLTFDDNQLEPALGAGLAFDNHNHITVDPSSLGPLNIDVTPDRTNDQDFQVQTNTDISINGNLVTLTKTFTTYSVLKTSLGLVVGIIPGSTTQTTETINIPEGYGYGYNANLTVSHRKGTLQRPNFYKKAT